MSRCNHSHIKRKLNKLSVFFSLYFFPKASSENGFTLIELLVVIAILGVQVTGLIAVINPAAKLAASRNIIRKTHLRQLADALERYKVSYGTYPITTGWCGASTSYWTSGCPGGDTTNWIPGLVASREIKSLPQEPLVGKAFAPCVNPSATTYLYYSNGVDYKILAYCGMEGTPPSPASDPFVDPIRPTSTWAEGTPNGMTNW